MDSPQPCCGASWIRQSVTTDAPRAAGLDGVGKIASLLHPGVSPRTECWLQSRMQKRRSGLAERHRSRGKVGGCAIAGIDPSPCVRMT